MRLAHGPLHHPGWLRRNHRLASVGTGGWFQSESLAAFIGIRTEVLYPITNGGNLVEAAAIGLYSREPNKVEINKNRWSLDRSGFRWYVKRGAAWVYIELSDGDAKALLAKAKQFSRTAMFRNSFFTASFFLKEPDLLLPNLIRCADAARQALANISGFVDPDFIIRTAYCDPSTNAIETAGAKRVAEELKLLDEGRDMAERTRRVRGLIQSQKEGVEMWEERLASCEGSGLSFLTDPGCVACRDKIAMEAQEFLKATMRLLGEVLEGVDRLPDGWDHMLVPVLINHRNALIAAGARVQ